MHVDYRKFMRDPIVGIGRVCGKLLMTKGDIVDSVLLAGVDESVVGVSALPEDFGDAFILQASGDKHGTVHEWFLLLGEADGYEARISARANGLLASPVLI